MPHGEVKEILVEPVNLVASSEEEVRSLQVLTMHRVDHSVTEKLGISQKSDALHLPVQSLLKKLRRFQE